MNLHYLRRLKAIYDAAKVKAISERLQKDIKELVEKAANQLTFPGVTTSYNKEDCSLMLRADGVFRRINIECDIECYDVTHNMIGALEHSHRPARDLQEDFGAPIGYIKQIGERICGHAGLLGVVEENTPDVLDDIEDKIINEDLSYIHSSKPVHESNVKFIPYVNRMHVKCAIRSSLDLISPHGKVKMVDFTGIPSDFSEPGLDILVEIGKVETKIRSHRRTPLLADNKGNIYTIALHRNSPVKAKVYDSANSNRTYELVTEKGTVTRPIRTQGIYFDVDDGDYIANQSTKKNGRHLVLADVTDQVMPLIRPKSSPHKYLESLR
jgi:hypothetical protein